MTLKRLSALKIKKFQIEYDMFLSLLIVWGCREIKRSTPVWVIKFVEIFSIIFIKKNIWRIFAY